MIRNKNTDKLCLAAIICAVLIALGLIVGCLWFASQEETSPAPEYLSSEYVSRLFDDSVVHEIDIRLPQVNWDYMVRFAEEEQYVLCDVAIDGETVKNVAIRPKGNSSLSAIKSQNSDRFSFKIEFDHYQTGNTYYGLDKLALNNLGQDVSCMKDYLTYRMMNEAGVPAPLASYAHIKLNGEDFGLYLAVEAVEDSFAFRNYGAEFGNIYKPECFAIENVTPKAFINTDLSLFTEDYSSLGPGDRMDFLGRFIRGPFENAFGDNMEVAALKYAGDDESRYQVFFESAVFDQTEEDRQSLIRALKTLGEDPSSAADFESLIPYFVVHNFVNNYDSYTGIFVHNYYLRENNGRISMIPWDYNLSLGIFTAETAFKSFLGGTPYDGDLSLGNVMDDRTSMVNYPIDTPTFTVAVEDRPLLAAVLKNERYLEEYHQTFQRFLDEFFASGKFEKIYQSVRNMITPYVDAGQVFYSSGQFGEAADAVHEYFLLREESIRRQLAGSLPATMEGQSKDYANLVDASDLNLAATVSFDSLVFGIRTEDITEILDAAAGDLTHDSEGVTQALSGLAEDPKAILPAAGRIVRSSSLLRRAISSALAAPFLLVLSLAVFLTVRKRTMKFQRRR